MIAQGGGGGAVHVLASLASLALALAGRLHLHSFLLTWSRRRSFSLAGVSVGWFMTAGPSTLVCALLVVPRSCALSLVRARRPSFTLADALSVLRHPFFVLLVPGLNIVSIQNATDLLTFDYDF